MKTLTIAFIVSMIATAAWAKGGDNHRIPGDDFERQLSAYSQVKVTFDKIGDFDASREAVKSFASFLTDSKIVSSYKFKDAGFTADFCIVLKTMSLKPLSVGKINHELATYPADLVNININSDLKKPCD